MNYLEINATYVNIKSWTAPQNRMLTSNYWQANQALFWVLTKQKRRLLFNKILKSLPKFLTLFQLQTHLLTVLFYKELLAMKMANPFFSQK